MNLPNDNDSLEKLLRDQPLDPVPASVYERLQKKAAWNQTPVLPWPLIFGLIACLSIIVFVIFWASSPDKPETQAPGEPVTPIGAPPASASIVAIALPTANKKPSDEPFHQFGGLSTRSMTNEPPFALDFGSEMDLSSIRRKGLDS